MRIIFLYLARLCRAIGNRHVDRADLWRRRADRFDRRAKLRVRSDNIATIEPYDPERHGEVRK